MCVLIAVTNMAMEFCKVKFVSQGGVDVCASFSIGAKNDSLGDSMEPLVILSTATPAGIKMRSWCGLCGFEGVKWRGIQKCQ